MKLKIKVKEVTPGCMPVLTEKGDWIDLKASKDYYAKTLPQADVLKYKEIDGKKVGFRDVKFKALLVDLGVAMQLPDGFEAVVLPRSSSFKNFGFIQTNSQGVIDQTYCGNNDVWKLPILCINNTSIHAFDRVCQFKIQLSQKATFWQKIKWFFSSGVELVKVDNLNNEARGGFGSTGVK